MIGTPIKWVASMLVCARQGIHIAMAANASAMAHVLDAGDDTDPDMVVSCIWFARQPLCDSSRRAGVQHGITSALDLPGDA
ncbi:exported hypothetical protein [Paraburkholderia sacchari]